MRRRICGIPFVSQLFYNSIVVTLSVVIILLIIANRYYLFPAVHTTRQTQIGLIGALGTPSFSLPNTTLNPRIQNKENIRDATKSPTGLQSTPKPRPSSAKLSLRACAGPGHDDTRRIHERQSLLVTASFLFASFFTELITEMSPSLHLGRENARPSKKCKRPPTEHIRDCSCRAHSKPKSDR